MKTRKVEISSEAMCRNCKGDGWVNASTCEVCQGSGMVTVHKEILITITPLKKS